MEIKIETTAEATRGAIRHFYRRQVPYASAVALTRTAQDARDLLRSRLSQHFKVRSKRVAAGIQIEPARKADWPNPRAQVGTLDAFMAKHVTGGEKRPERGAKGVAVPTRLVQRTSTGAVRSAQKPRALRQKTTTFVAVNKGTGKRRIVVRTLGKKGAVSNLGAGTFFLLRPSVKIAKRWPFEREAGEAVAGNYARHFSREFRAAVKSARAQPGRFTSSEGRAFYLRALRTLV